jgi:hypothetical protein
MRSVASAWSPPVPYSSSLGDVQRINLSINGVDIGSSDREVPQDFAGAPFSSVRAYVCTPKTLTETVEIAGAPRTVVWDRR